ncbi:Putative secretory lipase family protein [Mycolicibacterium fortuitum]|uniref:Secretory lipase family protein n=1 Tax=Mycolicibacterium fortuitum TaxID=1766 RepID=A0A378U5U8_MYCFO|nr:Putative secretory lipase family protein [Mycolicibacterium fortuitum]
MELAPRYAPELKVVGAWAGAPAADLALVPPFADGSIFAGGLGYLLNGVGAAYPELVPGLTGVLTDKGVNLVSRTQNECVGETVMRFGFRHYQQYFTADVAELINSEPLRTVLNEQRIGTLKPTAPVFIDSNRFDPFIPWGGARQLALDWCAKGADVQFWTNEQPPFLNKLAINNLLPYFVDGEQGMQWLADRFNGLPTTPNCTAIPA